MQQRQGDIFFVKLNTPATKKSDAGPKQQKGILAEGEVTGHCHAIRPIDLKNCDIFLDVKGKLIVRVKAGQSVTVEHPEHKIKQTILTEGDNEIRRQKEYEPSGWRQVSD